MIANSLLTDLASGNFNLNAEYNNTNTTQSIDLDKLANVIKQGKSSVTINIDKKGFQHYKDTSMGRTEFINSKYKYTV
jgi:hypothetical protein